MTFELDRTSLLVRVSGKTTLDAIERQLADEGLTLGVDGHGDEAVGGWLARGAPGAASTFVDPADHLVAGIDARLANGLRLEIAPSPRRAVGPDLVALCVGAHERFASIDHVWLRVHPRGARRTTFAIEGLDVDPPASGGERALLDAIARELAR